MRLQKSSGPQIAIPSIVSVSLSLLSCVSAALPELNDYERSTNQSLLWGPYRPNVYFGVRPRLPDGLMMGLLWSRVEDYETVQHSNIYIPHPPSPPPLSPSIARQSCSTSR
jgi:hypothetical protein